MFTHWKMSTFKREFALLAFGVWVFITYRIFNSTDANLINAWGSAYGTASTAVWLYVMSAFGMDFAAKQWSNRTISVSQLNNAPEPQTVAALVVPPMQPRLTAGGSLVG